MKSSADARQVIAIDGPAASGKSSVARELARKLGFAYVNSGAMYRAATWFVLDRGVDLEDATEIARVIESARIVCDLQDLESRIRIDGVDPAAHLRDERVNNGVSLVSSVPRVREILVGKMHEYARHSDVVMEGRDIGSVVFPETPFKFYIDASPEIRSTRRAAQGETDRIAARDRADSSRRASPLTIAADAHVIDSSHLPIEGVVAEIVERLKAKGFKTKTRDHSTVRQAARMNLWYWSGYYLSRLLSWFLFRFRVVHRERMIREGPAIFAMNHESYLDPPLAGIATGREVFFLARKTLLEVPLLGWLLPKLNVVPVDQEGNDRSALKALLRILKAGNATVVFPEGARTVDGALQPALPGLGFVIAKTLAPVVPMRIFGARAALPRGGGRLRFKRITIVVGEPLRFTEADLLPRDKQLYQRLSERVMESIAVLQLD